MARDPLTPYGNRPMVAPIVNAENYEYLLFEVLRQITDGEIDGYSYHRDDNPTVREVEHKIAALEQAEDCIVGTSGMAACTMVYLTYLRSGDHLVIFHDTYHQNPLKLGADLVVHSAAKSLGGHNDLMAGAITGSKEHYNRLWFTRQAIGTTLDAYSAFLLERGLKTFQRTTSFDVGTNTVRLFMGIEHTEKLLADPKQALACLDRGVTAHA